MTTACPTARRPPRPISTPSPTRWAPRRHRAPRRPQVSGRLDALTAEGLRHCRVSERSAPHLGAASARAAGGPRRPADGARPRGTADFRGPAHHREPLHARRRHGDERQRVLLPGHRRATRTPVAPRPRRGDLGPVRRPRGAGAERRAHHHQGGTRGAGPDQQRHPGAGTGLRLVHHRQLQRDHPPLPHHGRPDAGGEGVLPHHATHGHYYSADQLITPAALEADGRLTHGRRVLLLASNARSWFLTALERMDPTPA